MSTRICAIWNGFCKTQAAPLGVEARFSGDYIFSCRTLHVSCERCGFFFPTERVARKGTTELLRPEGKGDSRSRKSARLNSTRAAPSARHIWGPRSRSVRAGKRPLVAARIAHGIAEKPVVFRDVRWGINHLANIEIGRPHIERQSV